MGKWHYTSLNAVQEWCRTNEENIIYVNHLWNLVKINDKQNWVPFVVDFHLAAPNNKIVIKESYQLDFNSKHFQKKQFPNLNWYLSNNLLIAASWW